MAIFALISIAAFATTVSGLGCGDFSYDICHDPPANQELHVGSLEECIQNCDLFGSFDQCDYLLYFETGPDENCKIISGPGSPEEEMALYLKACSVLGQPMTSTGDNTGSCIEGPEDECSATCTAGCDDCTADPCSGYKGAQCLKNGSPGETGDKGLPYAACLTFCTLQMNSNPWSYMTYDKEQEECICYDDSTYKCSIQVVKYGMTIDQANACHV